MRTSLALGALGLLLAACSSSTGNDPNSGGSSSGGPNGPQPIAQGTLDRDDTWRDGKQIKGEVTIPDFVNITIAPGATVKCDAGAKIIVKGGLRATAKDKHAKITCNTWAGIVVADGGTLDTSGLELENADTGITTQTDSVAAKFDNGAITGSNTPFLVGPGSALRITSSKVVALGQSEVQGDFYASHLDYDKGGSNGIILGNAEGSLTIEDSVFHGTSGGEVLDSAAGKLVKVSYTTINGAHCAFHFDNVDSFEIDHVTANQGLVFSAMLYGSKTGGKITYSNLGGAQGDIDVQGTNGALTFDHVHTNGKDVFKNATPTITNKESSEVPNAKPR